MNAQTTSVIKTLLIGFSASFTVAAVNLLPVGQLSPTDSIWLRTPSIIGYWTTPIAIIPLFLALGAIAVTARKVPPWVSLVNSLGVIVAVPTFVSIISATFSMSRPSAPEFPYSSAGTGREWFVRANIETCRKKAHDNPQNATVSEQTVQDYCTCYAITLADITTQEHIQYQSMHGTLAPDAIEKLKASSARCVRSIRN